MNWQSHIVRVLCALLPKCNTAAVFTWPAFDDTARALVPALAKCRLNRVYYLASSDVVSGAPPGWDSRVTVVPKRSLRGAWAVLTSRYVFTTHQCYTSQFPRNVVSVNLWHGMPVKRIGWMSSKQVNRPRFTYELAASEFWRPIVAACMRPRKDVLVTGLPRCDRFSADDSVAVRRHLGGEAELCSKLVVWLPTYRHTERGDPEADGIDFHNEAQMPGFDPEAFESWLTARNIVCVIKPHPLGPRPRVRATGPLRIMDDEALGACGLTLYGLLGGSDALLTDVSSVYVDYLLLNRPVIHAFADREAYGATRGYTFDWTEDYFAGPVADTMAGVQTALEDVLAGRDTHAARRARLRELFHARPNDPAAASLLTQLGLKPAAE